MILKALLIFILQLIYVPLLTLRTTFVVKGEVRKASQTSMLEGVVYIISLGIVFSDLTNMYNIAAYILGYGVGVYLGCNLEKKLAIGYRTVSANITNKNKTLIESLRESKFGVTIYEGQGINGDIRYKLEILSHRNREAEVIELIKYHEPNAFIISYDLTQFKGGYLSKQMNK